MSPPPSTSTTTSSTSSSIPTTTHFTTALASTSASTPSSSNANTTASHSAAAVAHPNSHIALIAGVSGGAGGLFILCCLLAIISWCCVRRRKDARATATTARQEPYPPNMGYAAEAFAPPHMAPSKSPVASHARVPSSATYASSAPILGAPQRPGTTAPPSRSSGFSDLYYSVPRSSTPTHSSDAASAPAHSSEGPGRDPAGDFDPYAAMVLAPPGARDAAVVWAQSEKLRLANERISSASVPPSVPGPAAGPSSPAIQGGAVRVASPSTMPQEIIVQHRDSGVAVRELPPPYRGFTLSRSGSRAPFP